jgi:hypothetical protein
MEHVLPITANATHRICAERKNDAVSLFAFLKVKFNSLHQNLFFFSLAIIWLFKQISLFCTTTTKQTKLLLKIYFFSTTKNVRKNERQKKLF